MATNNSMTVWQDAALGTQDDIMRMASRIKLMVKGGDKLTNGESMALAQVSLITKLNPFIGEVWYIPGKGPMVGIAGARKYNNEQAAAHEGYTFPVSTPVSAEEAGATAEEIKAGVAAAYRVDIYDSVATEKYQKFFLETLKALREAGSKDPFGDAKEICGPKPVWTGYGYSTRAEQSRMNKQALAMKRAEADALKRKIVIPFGGEVASSDVAPAYDVDAESIDMDYPVEEKRSELQNLSELGFDADEPPITQAKPRLEGDDTVLVTVMGADTLDKLVAMDIFENAKAAAQVVSRLFVKQQKAPFKKIVELSRAYRGHKDGGKSTDDAIEATLEAA